MVENTWMEVWSDRSWREGRKDREVPVRGKNRFRPKEKRVTERAENWKGGHSGREK